MQAVGRQGEPPAMDRQPYHHGNLVEALLAAAIALIEEKGAENLSVRELAKRAGVSPAAPFRHFPNKTALLTAVAEQAMARLAQAVRDAQSALGPADPLTELRAIGQAYLGWALDNPTHFQVISSRTLIDFAGSPMLTATNEALRLTVADLLMKAEAQGMLRTGLTIETLSFTARALVYGLARMGVDRIYPEWNIREPARAAMDEALDLFFSTIRA